MTANPFKLLIFFIAILCFGCSPETKVTANKPQAENLQPVKVQRNPLPKELEQSCSVLYLTMGENQGNARMDANGHMVMSTRVTTFIREMTRQAVLIAARDELGLTTRDEMLGESAEGDQVRSLLIEFSVGTYPQFTDANVEFHPSDVQFSRDQYHKNHTPPYASVPMLFQLHTGEFLSKIEELERLSRESFKETLQYLNLKGEKQVPEKSETLLPESIRKQLEDLHAVSQFEAVREIHRLIGEQGESLPLLKGLVRGYSQLYLLTEHHKTTGSRVFQCRSILYAQRAFTLYGKTPETLALKATALSLATCFRLARIQYEELDKMAIGTDSIISDENAWMRLGRPLAGYDFEGVAHLTADKSIGDLAKLVLFMMYDYSDASPITYRKGGELSKNFPCARIYDGMMRANSFLGVDVDEAHYSVPWEKNLLERLGRIEPLPKKIRDALAAAKERPVKAKSFWNFGDSYASPFVRLAKYQIPLAQMSLSEDAAELSFPALARLLREEAFVQIELISQMVSGRNGNPDSFLVAVEPVLEDHPLKNALYQYLKDDARRNEYAMNMKGWKIPFPLLDINSCTVWQKVQGRIKKEYRLPTPDIIASNSAAWDVYRDSYWIYRRDRSYRMTFDHGGTFETTRRLGFAAPNSPLALRTRIRERWRFNNADIEAWMPRVRQFHYIGTAILERLGYGDDAEMQEKILKTMHDNYPDKDISSRLANFYRQYDRNSEGIEIMKQYLAIPDAKDGLNEANASSFIASLYMEEKRFEEALPFARRAAASYASWGLIQLGCLYEAMGMFDDAEKVFQTNVENYSRNSYSLFNLYKFYYRTNNTKIAKPKKMLDEIWNDPENPKKSLADYASFYKIRQKPFPEGLESFSEQYLNSQSESTGRMALLDLLEEGDLAKTLEYFPFLRKEWPRSSPLGKKTTSMSSEWGMFLNMVEPELLAGGPAGRFDEKELQYLLQMTRNHSTADYAYLLGRYFDLAGNHAKAVEYYKLCVGQTAELYHFSRSLALNELRKDGFTNEDYLAVMKDPATVVPFKALPKGTLNRLCTLIFRDYSEDPSSRLKPAANEKTKVEDPHFLHSHDSLFEKGVYYKVIGGKFQGEELGPDQSMLRIRIREGWLQLLGYGRRVTFSFDTTDLSSEPIKVRLTDWGSEATFRGLMTLGGSPKLCLNLDEGGDYPKAMDDPMISNLIFFELKTTDTAP